MGRVDYKEIVRGTIEESGNIKKNVVVSEVHEEGREEVRYSVSKQLAIHEEDGKDVEVFLKSGIPFMNKETFEKVTNVLTEALELM